MNPESKVTAEHLQRAAYLYIRQSTLRQVLENTESTERQYALRQRAVSLGWPEDHIVVIDHDQGQSGASASEREGFQRLVAAVGLGEDPKGGALFVFCNRRHTRIKILCWDGTGLWILTKRLEAGTFAWPKVAEPERTKLALTPQALAMLTDGVDLRGAKLRPWYERPE